MGLQEHELTDPERRLCKAAAAGRVLDLRSREAGGDDPADGRSWGPSRMIRAGLLRQLVRGEEPVAPRPIAVRVRGARVVGPLNLGGRTLICPLELYECYLGDPVDLAKADAPAISLRGSYLHRRLSARGLRLERTLNLSRGFQCRAPLRLRGARVGGQLDLSGGTFHHPRGDAISAEGAQVQLGLVCGERFVADGVVRLRGARIGMRLDLSGATFHNPTGEAFIADGMHLDGDLLGRGGFVADGAVRLGGAHIGGVLDLTGAKFRNPQGDAISADRLRVEENLICRHGFEADGQVWLRGAHIGGVLDLTGAKFRNPHGDAINAAGLRVDIRAFCHPEEVTGALNLAFAEVAVWSDNAIGRSTPTVLRGFRYDALRPGSDEVGPSERIAWLNRDPGYSPQPYRQLAGIYRGEGHDASARKVLVASENRRRRTRERHWPRRAWGRVLWGTVRYGYQPWIALLWILALTTVGTLIIMARPDAELTPGFSAPPRNALLYTLDTLLPFVDLGYSRWVPHGRVLTVTTILIGLGWVLATAVVAAFADVMRRSG